MFDNDVLIIQYTLSFCNKCIHPIAEAVPIIKDDATAQLRISSVLPRKDGRWNVLYAVGFKKNTIYTILYGKKWRKKGKEIVDYFCHAFLRGKNLKRRC